MTLQRAKFVDRVRSWLEINDLELTEFELGQRLTNAFWTITIRRSVLVTGWRHELVRWTIELPEECSPFGDEAFILVTQSLERSFQDHPQTYELYLLRRIARRAHPGLTPRAELLDAMLKLSCLYAEYDASCHELNEDQFKEKWLDLCKDIFDARVRWMNG